MKLEFTSAVIVAAGLGSRMGKEINKQYLLLGERPILYHTISAFDKCSDIDEIIIVIGKGEEDLVAERIISRYQLSKPFKVVFGGSTRQKSVYAGMKAVDDNATIIAIHDGARPLITPEEISLTVKSAKEFGCGVLAVPIKETLKKVSDAEYIDKTIARELLYTAQTPQTFRREIVFDAHEKAIESGLEGTDDSYLCERAGYKVRIVEGSYDNIKITTPQDLIVAKQLLEYRK